MPFPVILRTSLLLSSVGVAAAYALYENNPTFRAFIDRTVDQISKVWEDLLSQLTPQERQEHREHQRGLLLETLGGRSPAALPTSSSARAASTAGTSGTDVSDGRARRRQLWELAEANAAEIRNRAAVRGRLGMMGRQSAPEAAASTPRATAHNASNTTKTETLFSAEGDQASCSPGVETGAQADSAKQATLSSATSKVSQQGRQTAASMAKDLPMYLAGEAIDSVPEDMLPVDSSSHPDNVADLDDDASSISTETYSNIMTPPSPSIASVSEVDATEADADPPVSDIESLLDRSATPSTMSLSDTDEVMSLASGFSESDAGWATADSGDEEPQAIQGEPRHRL